MVGFASLHPPYGSSLFRRHPTRSLQGPFSLPPLIRLGDADPYTMRRSPTSICTSELAPASEWVDLVWVRSGVSRLRQPPRSTERPGSPIGSEGAEDSEPWPQPPGRASVGRAAPV